MVAFFAAPSVMAALGWRALFWTFPISGAAWCVLWLLIATDSPSKHPRVSEAERRYIMGDKAPTTAAVSAAGSLQASLEVGLLRSGAAAASSSTREGWREMIRSPALWGQIFVDFASNYFFYVVFTFLPQYLSVALGFSIEDASWLTGVNIAMGIISTNLAGVVGDGRSSGREDGGCWCGISALRSRA